MKYLSAEALGITPEERKALIKVKKFLKTLDNVSEPSSSYRHNLSEVENPSPAKFTMNRGTAVYDCGTAACIGGWMKLFLLGVALKKMVLMPKAVAQATENYISSFLYDSDMESYPLKQLFYPKNIPNYDTITPALAIAEITKFLTTGKAEW